MTNRFLPNASMRADDFQLRVDLDENARAVRFFTPSAAYADARKYLPATFFARPDLVWVELTRNVVELAAAI